MSYSIPVTSGQPLSKEKIQNIKYEFDSILDQQIIISQLAKGITYEDTENMDEYERIYVIQKLLKMKKEENEAKQKAIDSLKK